MNIIRIHPGGIGDLLGHVVRVKRKFNGYFIAPVVSAGVGGGGIVAEVESIRGCIGLVVEGELEATGIAGKGFAIRGNIRKEGRRVSIC